MRAINAGLGSRNRRASAWPDRSRERHRRPVSPYLVLESRHTTTTSGGRKRVERIDFFAPSRPAVRRPERGGRTPPLALRNLGTAPAPVPRHRPPPDLGSPQRPRLNGEAMRRIRLRPSPAIVIACIALFVALGGTAMAAVVITNNNQVARNTISGHNPPSGKHANIIGGSVSGQDLSANVKTSLGP